MDKEEKELLKKILKKVDSLEEKLKEKDEEIKRLREQKPQTQPKPAESSKPKIPEIKETGDKFTDLMVQLAREKAEYESEQRERERRTAPTVEEIRKNFDLGEVALFAIKRNLLKKGKEKDVKSTTSIHT